MSMNNKKTSTSKNWWLLQFSCCIGHKPTHTSQKNSSLYTWTKKISKTKKNHTQSKYNERVFTQILTAIEKQTNSQQAFWFVGYILQVKNCREKTSIINCRSWDMKQYE